MREPYFEDIKLNPGSENYPFSCSVSESMGRDFIINPHWHNYIELLYFLSGHARVFIGGEWYDAWEGDFVFINACEVHSITAGVGEDTKYVVIKFDPEILYMAKSVFEMKYVLPLTLGKVSYQKIFNKDELKGTFIPQLIKEIHMEYTQKTYGFELAVQTGICRVFLWVLRGWASKGIDLETGCMLKEVDINRFQKLFDYIDENYKNPITAQKAATICNMSYSYFSRQFKKTMGKTFTEYLNYIRIREAEKLLLTTDMNVTQVALNTGFTNSSYFIKQFKYFKNISPKKFRQRV